MTPTSRRLKICAAIAFVAGAGLALASPANAMHYRHHHMMMRMAAEPVLVPAHERPGYASAARLGLPGLIDLGLGPVFPFSGWP